MLITNPFDFTSSGQFAPITVVGVCLMVLTGLSIKNHFDLQSIHLYSGSLEDSLKKIIPIFEKPWKLVKGNILLMIVAATSFPLAFISRTITSKGLWTALAYELASIIVSALIVYLIGSKTGIFRERHAARFREDLKELEELKKLSAEIAS